VNAIRKWVVPSGYRELADLVREHGREHTQANLMSGQWPAFRFDLYTGNLEPLPPTIWCAARGHTWLEKGSGGRIEISRAGGRLEITSYAVLVWASERLPPWRENPKGADGPKVHIAKELMDAIFQQGEWRQMGVRAVRKGCEQEAKTRRVPLPSEDSFSRAMGRRRK
jgi:hypothetical protein